jgi:metallophosphoesterase superfamily enzyme
MRKVGVWAEVSDIHFRAYESEARRRGVPVENLVQQTVNSLLRELERDEEEDRDHDLTTS